jgi:hypothetical protein
VAGLLVSLFAATGVLSWSQFSREIPNLRVGVCLLIVGYLLTRWFDDHPDASAGLRDGTDPSLRAVAGFDAAPLTDDVWP